MPNFQNEDQDGSKSRWIADTHKVRREASQIRTEYISPDMVRTRPFDVPRPVGAYNQLLHQYAGQLRPKQNDFQERWNEDVIEVTVPKDGDRVDAGRRLWNGQYDGADPISLWDHHEASVALNDLTEWQRGKTAALNARYFDANQGRQTQTITKTLALPAYAVDALIDQLNACLEKLGWLPEAAVKDYQATEPI